MTTTLEVDVPAVVDSNLARRERDIQNSKKDIRSKDGKIIGRFPPQRDPETLHQVSGHSSDLVNEMLSKGSHGYPVLKGHSSQCQFCASRHKRRRLRRRIEGLHRRRFKPGEAFTMDFTAMVSEPSIDNNRVGIVFMELETGTPLGQPL